MVKRILPRNDEVEYYFKSNGQEDIDEAVKKFSSLFLLLCSTCKSSKHIMIVVKDRMFGRSKTPLDRWRVNIICTECKTKYTLYAK